MTRADLAGQWRVLTDPYGAGQLTAGILLTFILAGTVAVCAASVRRSREG